MKLKKKKKNKKNKKKKKNHLIILNSGIDMVEICIETLCRIFLSNENKCDLKFRTKMVKNFN